jgi:hypothetical protein
VEQGQVVIYTLPPFHDAEYQDISVFLLCLISSQWTMRHIR